ncbi:MAG: hypothetical protein MI723_04730 [Caulobacterales bacterium]|nr:hypothetical protein [Caulobacterales bacterium]
MSPVTGLTTGPVSVQRAITAHVAHAVRSPETTVNGFGVGPTTRQEQSAQRVEAAVAAAEAGKGRKVDIRV